jgi:hypothetical protein
MLIGVEKFAPPSVDRVKYKFVPSATQVTSMLPLESTEADGWELHVPDPPEIIFAAVYVVPSAELLREIEQFVPLPVSQSA